MDNLYSKKEYCIQFNKAGASPAFFIKLNISFDKVLRYLEIQEKYIYDLNIAELKNTELSQEKINDFIVCSFNCFFEEQELKKISELDLSIEKKWDYLYSLLNALELLNDKENKEEDEEDEEAFKEYLIQNNIKFSENKKNKNVFKINTLYSFKEDAEKIFSSFIQAYNINLLDVIGVLSWDEFIALFNSLPENTIFSKVLQIRSYKKENEKISENERMSKLKKEYELKEAKIKNEEIEKLVNGSGEDFDGTSSYTD